MRPAGAGIAVAALLATAGCEGPGTSIGGDTAFAVTPLEVPAGTGSAQAHLATLPDGRLLLSWLDPEGEGGHALRFAALGPGGDWDATGTVVRRERLFVNWVDFPSVVPIAANVWVAHWLELQPDSLGAYDARISVSRDGGGSWSPDVRLNEDETEAEHGFVEIFPDRGAAAAFWLDGRELANWSFDEPDALLGVSLRVARIDAGGGVADRRIVDPLVCDCCQPDVAVAAGTPIVAYRDRTEDEIRDIAVRRVTDTGWSAPTDIGGERWRIEGCPVNGPAIDAVGDAVAVAWFTAADGKPRVRLARSQDAGSSFGEPLDVDVDGAMGQVDVVGEPGGDTIVSWWRRGAEGGIDLALRRVTATGGMGPIRIVAHEQVSQPIDVPQMLADGAGLVVVWTSFDGDGEIRAARIAAP